MFVLQTDRKIFVDDNTETWMLFYYHSLHEKRAEREKQEYEKQVAAQQRQNRKR